MKGLKVIELASVLAGPSVGQFFAELGAEVIKVENSKTGGDVTRSWLGKTEVRNQSISSYFTSVNWGKKSVTANLTDSIDREKVIGLIADADIVIASYKPGDAQKLGMDYPNLSRLYPRLIYGQITGYGSDDPRVGYDAVIQAESGFMSINGKQGDAPLKMPIAMIDLLAGHHLKEAILVALLERVTSNHGKLVEVSLMDVAISSLVNQGTNWLVGGIAPKAQGNAHPNIAPYGELFRTKDAVQIILAVGTDKQFKALCSILDLSPQEIFLTNQGRVKHRIVLNEILSNAISHWLSADLLTKLHQNQIPAGVLKTIDQVLEQGSKDWFLKTDSIRGLRTFAAKGFDLINLSPPPQLGEHNQEIFQS